MMGGWLFAGAASRFLLSLPFLLFRFSLSSPPLSVLFSKIDLGMEGIEDHFVGCGRV
jgi:hypothetical protein